VTAGPVQLAHPVAQPTQAKSDILPYLPTGQLIIQFVAYKKYAIPLTLRQEEQLRAELVHTAQAGLHS
jgi:hypothetical protein